MSDPWGRESTAATAAVSVRAQDRRFVRQLHLYHPDRFGAGSRNEEQVRERDRLIEEERRGLIPLSNWQTIVREVAKKHGVSVTHVFSHRRLKPLVAARHEAWWRMTEETDLSLSGIARRFGRDHTTVIHGVAKHKKRMADDQTG